MQLRPGWILRWGWPNGVDYLERLRQRQTRFPDGYVHLWYRDKIIGQVEMQILEEPRIGYVNLFYLIAEMRGTGAATTLHCLCHGSLRKTWRAGGAVECEPD